MVSCRLLRTWKDQQMYSEFKLDAPGHQRFAFFFPYVTGHNLEYLRHIDRELSAAQPGFGHLLISLASNKAILEPLSEELSLRLLYIKSPSSRPSASTFGAIKNTFLNIRMLRALQEACESAAVNECVIMHLNPFQIALPFTGGSHVKYRGIFFFPYFRLEKEAAASLKNKLNLFFKKQAMSFMCRFARLRTVFILNDKEAAEALDKCHGSDSQVFRFIPDPIPHFSPLVEPDERLGTPKLTFSLLGAIDERKGVFFLMESVRALHPELMRAMRLVICGRFSPQDELRIAVELENLSAQCPNLEVVAQNRFIANEEFSALVGDSDFLLLPYQRSEGSSGILGHASAHKRPVIGPKSGLVGALIEQYKLGAGIDMTAPTELTKVFECALKGDFNAGFNPVLAQTYVEERLPGAFVEQLIQE